MSSLSELQIPEVRSPAGSACLNCGSPLTGAFCASCGQRDVPPYPSVRDLVVDAFWELSGWDGRFAATLRALVQRPGMLTREFLEGRRSRYISPLRLYLMASLVYFVLAASAPSAVLKQADLDEIRVAVSQTPASTQPVSRPERVGKAASAAITSQKVLSPEERQAALKDIEKAPAVMRPFLRKVVGDPTGFKRGVVEAMPRMLFALLPIFALIVALFYRRRKYPEHLYFAIHLHAFMFFALGVTVLVKFTRLPTLVAIVGVLAFAWIAVYATLAFRRVYGGSLVRTLAKQVAIGMIYSAVSFVAFIVMVYWVSVVG
ncbi:MAG: DUF3667 domain-containing protein [bacterium]